MTITLPIPPSTNGLYATVRGRRVLSAECRRYKNEAALIALAKGMRPIDGPISVAIDVYRKRKAGDLDNYLKSALDSLKGVAWHDDSQIEVIYARRFDDNSNPCIVISVEAKRGDSPSSNAVSPLRGDAKNGEK